MPAPWPCWSIAAARTAPKPAVTTFLADLQPYVRNFDSAESRAGPAVDYVVETFGQQRADVEEWLKTVKWEANLAEVSEGVVRKTLGVLEKAGVVKPGDYPIDMFVDGDVAKVVDGLA